MTEELSCVAVTGIGEIGPGDDLAAIIADRAELRDGDVVVVTSKVVSKSEGLVVSIDRTEALAQETVRTVARRGDTSIVRNRQGLVIAAAGIDASNTEPGTVVLLPREPDASARRLREGLAERTGRNVAVVLSDTAGRTWRHGQTDIAIGAAGIDVLRDYAGATDSHGNHLSVTAPALADEIAAAGDLVKGKIDRLPVAVLRGLGGIVRPPGDHGPGARVLVRDESEDMFGYGAREAVVAAVEADPTGLRGFGRAASAEDLVGALTSILAPDDTVTGAVTAGTRSAVAVLLEAGRGEGAQRGLGRVEARLAAVGFAMGWSSSTSEDQEPKVSLRFSRPTP